MDAVNFLDLNISSGNIGAWLKYSWKIKIKKLKKKMINAIIRLCVLVVLIRQYVSEAIVIIPSSCPQRSSFDLIFILDVITHLLVRYKHNRPNGRLIKKIPRQLNITVMNAPNMGPNAAAIPAIPAHVPIALDNSDLSGYEIFINEIEDGTNNAALMPWDNLEIIRI